MASLEGQIMKRCLLLVGLLLMILWGTGCVVIDVDKVRLCRPATVEISEATIPLSSTPSEGPAT